MWQIEHECPQCGAPVILEETERLFACNHCRARLYIASDSLLRYYLPPVRLEDGRIIYVPYRRTKGIDFTCRVSGITTGVIDRTSLALSAPFFPYSLGVRPQVFKLRFVGRTVEQALLGPCMELRDAEEEGSTAALFADRSLISDPVLFRVAIREVDSLIYCPVCFTGDTLRDAIDGKNLGRMTEEALADMARHDDTRDEVSFVPSLCPNCGIDLMAEKESIMLFCSNCLQAWNVAGGSLQSASVAFLPAARDARYLPFWSVPAHVEGAAQIDDRLFVDPVKMGLQCSRRVYLDEPGFRFWLPAFKVNPSIFLKLAERATVTQPALNEATAEGGDALYPVTLPAREAVRLVKVIVTLLAGSPEAARPWFDCIAAEPGEAQLCFIPFSFSGYELIHERMRVSIFPNALKYGKNL